MPTPLHSYSIAIPVKSDNIADAMMKMEYAAPKADFIEIWIDQLEEKEVFKLIKHKPKPLIIVNKPIRERGHFIGSEEKRVQTLINAIEFGADFVDIGLDTNSKLIKKVVQENRGHAKIIMSYHNFQNTPEESELKKIIEKGARFKADIVKLACKATNHFDNLKMFTLLQEYKRKKTKLIALCMGSEGKISRVFAPFLGSYFTYAPLQSNLKTAPGQLTVEQLETIWKMIK